jgi:hypothetical protein
MEVMTQMMLEMIDMMAKSGAEVIALMESSAVAIGVMSDDIVDMEHMIMDMALTIGDISDELVDIEAWALQFGELAVFSGGAGSVVAVGRPPRVDRSRRVVAEAGRARALKKGSEKVPADTVHSAHGIVSGGFGDFAEMVDLMIKMAATMESLMVSELSEMKDIADACGDMAHQITLTMGYITEMAQEITIMATRIVTTTDLMNSLLDECSPSAAA